MKLKGGIQVYKTLLAVAILSFTASCDNSLPFRTVTTTVVTDVTSTTATVGGKITNDNNIVTTVQGICWSTKTGPTITDSKTSSTTIAVDFTGSLTGLTPNTTYHARAYLSNSDNTVYGSEISFTTAAANGLALTTVAATGVTTTAATTGGNIVSDGGSAVTARGVCWSTTAAPTTASSKTTDGTGTGVFASSLTGLSPNTLYYVRAYATNANGTAYGNELTFTTSQATAVALTTAAATGIATTAATSGGNITSDGGLVIVSRGVCWSTC